MADFLTYGVGRRVHPIGDLVLCQSFIEDELDCQPLIRRKLSEGLPKSNLLSSGERPRWIAMGRVGDPNRGTFVLASDVVRGAVAVPTNDCSLTDQREHTGRGSPGVAGRVIEFAAYLGKHGTDDILCIFRLVEYSRRQAERGLADPVVQLDQHRGILLRNGELHPLWFPLAGLSSPA